MPRALTIALAAALLTGPPLAGAVGARADPAHSGAAEPASPTASSAALDSPLPIPGLAGGGLMVGGVARVDDGGALIAASTRTHAHSRWHLTITRLRLDGTVDLAYGARGVASAGSGARASAIAIDPRTGAAWIGAATERGGGEVVALTANGGRARGFGRDGVLRLPAALSGAPVALAWRHGELVVAAGTKPCAGCVVGAVDPASGALRRSVPLAVPPSSPGSETCRPAAVSAVALAGSAVLLTTVSRPVEATTASPEERRATSDPSNALGGGCSAQLLSLHDRSLTATDSIALGGAQSATLASASGQTCIAESSQSQTALGSLTGNGSLGELSVAPAGSVIEAVALGASACAALIAPARGGGAVVAQGQDGDPHASVARLPRTVRPLGLSRCEHHLLTIGARRAGETQQGVVAVIPVRVGPHARSAAAASIQCRSTPLLASLRGAS